MTGTPQVIIAGITAAEQNALAQAARLAQQTGDDHLAQLLDRMARSAAAALLNYRDHYTNHIRIVPKRYRTWRDVPSVLMRLPAVGQ